MIMDIGVGMLIGVLVNFLTTNEPNIYFVIFGIFAALAPDIDYMIYMIKNNWKRDKYSHNHRDLLHHPILFSVCGAVIFYVVNPALGMIWFCGTMYHFVHDTFNAWGIRWGSPFLKQYILIAGYSPKNIIRNKEEQALLVEKYGNDNWLKDGYLTLNTELVAEIIFFVAGTVATVIWLS